MIETTTPSTLVQELPVPDPDFRVESREQLGVIIPSAIELRAVNNAAEVQWSEPTLSIESEQTRRVLDEIVAASKREADRNPRSVRALINYGIALLNADMVDAAGAQFEAAHDMAPTDVSTVAHLARVRLLQQRVAEAHDLAQTVRRLDPSSTLGALLDASVAIVSGQPTAAAKALSDATRLAPDQWLPWYLLGFLSIAQNRGREAVNYLRAAARTQPRSAAIQHALGVAFGLEGQWDKAIRTFRQALTLAPQRRETVLALAHVFLRRNSTDDAIGLLSDWAAAVPQDREAQELLAHAYYIMNNYRAARRHLHIALKAIPVDEEYAESRARVLNNIGVCAAKLGATEEAVQWYTRSLRAVATSIVFRNLAQAYRRLGNSDLAYRVLAAAIAHDPNDASTKLLSSVTAGELGYADKAIETLNELLLGGNAVADVYACLGWILADEKRDYKRALTVLSDGYRLYPADSVIANNLAYVNLMLGDVKRAREILGAVPESELQASVYLTATRGLLSLAEGDMQKAAMLYSVAEQLARREGRTNLAKVVRQKMYLELARAYLRAEDTQSAQDNVKRGLAIHGRRSYHDDLKFLKDRLLAS